MQLIRHCSTLRGIRITGCNVARQQLQGRRCATTSTTSTTTSSSSSSSKVGDTKETGVDALKETVEHSLAFGKWAVPLGVVVFVAYMVIPSDLTLGQVLGEKPTKTSTTTG